MHGVRIPSVLLPAVLATAGCAPSLEIGHPVAPLPARFEAAAPHPSPEPAALDRWWTLFGDAQLDDLVARALHANADVRLGLARLREAQAIRRAALAPFRVQGDLQVTGGVQRSESLSGPDVLIGGPGGTAVTSGATVAATSPTFNLSWELDLLGRRGIARAAADADLAAARFVQEGTRATLVADVADALFAARGLAAQAEAARETLTIQRGILAAVRTRADRGLAARADVARIDADAAQAEAQATQLEAELAATRRAILVLLGEADKPLDTLPITTRLDLPPQPPAALPGMLLERRPDVREAEQRLRSAIARAGLQRLELFPRLTLNPGAGLTATRGGGLNAVSAFWTLGAGLTMPILDRARLLAQMRVEGARAEQAVIAYERAVQTAFSEADQSLLRLAGDRARVALLARAEGRADEAYAADRLRFARGLNDLPTLLETQRVRSAAHLAAATARAETLRRAVTVFRALGGGWQPAPNAVSLSGE